MPFQNLVAQKLAQGAIETSTSTIYITPPNTQAYVKDICVCNTSTNKIAVTIYLVSNGASAGTTGSNANALYYQFDIDSHTTLHWTGVQILNAGDTIQVLAAATGLVITISGAQAV